MLKMDLEYKKGIFFIRLDGSLKEKNCYKINNYINPVIKKHNIKRVIYNLENLKSIDASGVFAILNTKCTVKNNKGKIFMCGLNENVYEKLKHLRIKTRSSEKEIMKLIEV